MSSGASPNITTGAAGTPGTPRAATAIVLVSIVAFVFLGLPEGSIGVTFPAIRETFGLPLSALGLLLFPLTAGYLTATVGLARFAEGVPIGRILVGSAMCSVIGAAAYTVAPAFAVLMLGSFVLGLAGGGLDSSLNSYVSVHMEHRVLAFMHGGFGLGAAIGPAAVIAILSRGGSWRVAYGVIALVNVGLGFAWFRLRHAFITATPADDVADTTVVGFEGDVAETVAGSASGRTAVGVAAPPRSRGGAVVGLSVMMFFLYTGVEASTGFLAATLLVARGVAPDTAGLLTTVYWSALTVGRFGTGAIGARLSPSRALGIGSIGVAAGMSLVAFGGTTLAPAGLILLGLSLAPFFPSLVALTPSRVGVERARRSIGIQLAAASLGVTCIPAVISIIADHAGALTIGPCLLVAALALCAGHVVTGSVAGDLRTPSPAAS